jgi:hypothetical protein
MKLLVKALSQRVDRYHTHQDQLAIATLFVTSRAICHSSLAPNLFNLAYDNENNFALSSKTQLLLINAGTIQFTPKLRLDTAEYDDLSGNIKQILTRLRNTEFSRRSLKYIRGIDLDNDEQKEFIADHMEVAEEIRASWKLPEPDSLKFFTTPKFASGLRSLEIHASGKVILTGILRKLPALENFSCHGADSLSDDEFLEIAHVRRLKSLEMIQVGGLTGATFAEVFDQLEFIEKLSFTLCYDLSDISGIAVASNTLVELKIGLGDQVDRNGLAEWSNYSFPRLKKIDCFPLVNENWKSEDAKLFSFLSTATNLEYFHSALSFEPPTTSPTTTSTYDTILEYLSNCPRLRHVDISGTASSQGVTENGLRALSKCTKLEELFLRDLEPVHPDGLREVLPRFSNLRTLQCPNIKIGEGNLKGLAALKQLRSLTLRKAEFVVSTEIIKKTIFETQFLNELYIEFVAKDPSQELCLFDVSRSKDTLRQIHLLLFVEPERYEYEDTKPVKPLPVLDGTNISAVAENLSDLFLTDIICDSASLIDAISKARLLKRLHVVDARDDLLEAIANNTHLRITLGYLRLYKSPRLTMERCIPFLKTILNTKTFHYFDCYDTPHWYQHVFKQRVLEKPYKNRVQVHAMKY